MQIKNFLMCFLLISAIACDTSTNTDPDPKPDSDICTEESLIASITQRNFKMGFTTWSYGPTQADMDSTMDFISANADLYAEPFDNKIPWNALINNTSLPTEYTNDIQSRVDNKIVGHELLLSISLLNDDRSGLLKDFDGTTPAYTTWYDQNIEDAYFDHIDYLITRLNPDYLVTAMEVNDLRLKSESRWEEYKVLISNIRTRLKSKYPSLPMAESITLHNWLGKESDYPAGYVEEIADYINQNNDFAAISFYPFFKAQHEQSEFQEAFDFLKSKISVPIAIVETAHLAEDLVVENYDLNIPSDACEQKAYLESLLFNANDQNYKFIIWWTHRDFDALWETFPESVQDLGKLWRDTGLLDGNGEGRPAYDSWVEMLNK